MMGSLFIIFKVVGGIGCGVTLMVVESASNGTPIRFRSHLSLFKGMDGGQFGNINHQFGVDARFNFLCPHFYMSRFLDCPQHVFSIICPLLFLLRNLSDIQGPHIMICGFYSYNFMIKFNTHVIILATFYLNDAQVNFWTLLANPTILCGVMHSL